MRKDYQQTCGLARALELVGERWTLLVVRELLVGPKRFADLLEGLPGIPPSLLSSRLKEMQNAGVITKEVLPPPAPSTVYRLTATGTELEPAVLALGRWGVHFGRKLRPTDVSKPGSLAIALRALFRPHAASGLHETYELKLPAGPVTLTVHDGALDIRYGPAENPRLVVGGKQLTVMRMLAGQLEATDLVRRGDVTIQGDRKAIAPLIGMFAAGTTARPAVSSSKGR